MLGLPLLLAHALAMATSGAPDTSAFLHTADERSRLAGHSIEEREGGHAIIDIAGEGPPLVGCVLRRDSRLVLKTQGEELVLEGPLAIPRIAGPHYKVWAIGTRDGARLTVRRLGILARPGACDANS